MSMPESRSHSRFVRMPVAMITTSAGSASPFFTWRMRVPRRSSIRVTVTPVRIATPCRVSHPATIPAQPASTILGRMRGATSTMVSRAPRERMALRMVKEMKPAPTMTTRRPGVTAAMTARASSSVQKECNPGPSAPGIGGRAAREPVAIRQSSYSTRVPSSSVRALASGSSAAARRPISVLTFQAASEAGVAVKTWDSAMLWPR